MKVFYFVWHPIMEDIMEDVDKILDIHYLTSYYFIKSRKYTMKFNNPYFLDSGAFSAYTSGGKINIVDYINFIKRNKQHIGVYANLDEIGNAEKTLRNQRIMEEAGLNPIPVFHAYEDYKYLKDYIKKYDYICLGGLAQLKTYPKIKQFFKECFEIIGNKDIKVHAFGISDKRLLMEFPFHSADSSSFSSGGRFGHICHYERGRLKKYNREKAQEKLNFTFGKGMKNSKKMHEWNITQWYKYINNIIEKTKNMEVKTWNLK